MNTLSLDDLGLVELSQEEQIETIGGSQASYDLGYAAGKGAGSALVIIGICMLFL